MLNAIAVHDWANDRRQTSDEIFGGVSSEQSAVDLYRYKFDVKSFILSPHELRKIRDSSRTSVRNMYKF